MTPSRWVKLGAEFLAIGAGVFLGLLADDWRDLRNERSAGLSALELVREDLRRDSVELETTRESLRTRAELGPWLVRNRQRTVAPDSTVRLVTSIYTLPRYRRIRPAYVDLRATGRLDLVQSEELRSALVDYFELTQEQFAQELSDWLAVREALITEYNDYFTVSGPDSLRSILPNSPDLTLDIDWAALRRDRAATMIAVRYSGLATVTARRAAALLEANASVGQLIDAVLAGR